MQESIQSHAYCTVPCKPLSLPLAPAMSSLGSPVHSDIFVVNPQSISVHGKVKCTNDGLIREFNHRLFIN